MLEISENALLMSIQAIHQIIERHTTERNARTGPEQARYDEIIEAYEIAAMELRKTYEGAIAQGADLPPYADVTNWSQMNLTPHP